MRLTERESDRLRSMLLLDRLFYHCGAIQEWVGDICQSLYTRYRLKCHYSAYNGDKPKHYRHLHTINLNVGVFTDKYWWRNRSEVQANVKLILSDTQIICP